MNDTCVQTRMQCVPQPHGNLSLEIQHTARKGMYFSDVANHVNYLNPNNELGTLGLCSTSVVAPVSRYSTQQEHQHVSNKFSRRTSHGMKKDRLAWGHPAVEDGG